MFIVQRDCTVDSEYILGTEIALQKCSPRNDGLRQKDYVLILCSQVLVLSENPMNEN